MSTDMLVLSSLPGIHAVADSSLPAVLNTTDYLHRCGLPFSKGRARLFLFVFKLEEKSFLELLPLAYFT